MSRTDPTRCRRSLLAPAPRDRAPADAESGFTLLFVIVLTAIVLIALSVAAPVVARQLRREREVESIHRADEYVRAIRLYYRKFGHYPGSLDELEKANNIRFLRRRFPDPLTGEANWRLIHVGENKTTVTGFFGQPLAGPLPPGLGSAAGMQSGIGGAGSTSGSTPALGAGFASGSGNQSTTPGTTAATPGGTSTGTGSTTGGTTGSSSSTSSNPLGGGGPIMGIGSAATGDAIVAVNDKSTYPEWEFLYDPRIELMRSKSSLLGGPAQSGNGASTAPGTPGATTTNPNTPGATGTPTQNPTTAPGSTTP